MILLILMHLNVQFQIHVAQVIQATLDETLTDVSNADRYVGRIFFNTDNELYLTVVYN